MNEPWRVSAVGFDSPLYKPQERVERVPLLNEAQFRVMVQELAKRVKRARAAEKRRRTKIRKMQKYTLTLEELVLFHRKCSDRTLYRGEEGEELAVAVLDDWIFKTRKEVDDEQG